MNAGENISPFNRNTYIVRQASATFHHDESFLPTNRLKEIIPRKIRESISQKTEER